ncbi:hypothetical protein HRG_003700 [Hirsutella rhossiliensis]|uniref:Uncharacterized protein n=1 Tax=Hirsutella rhossiliensis TaxID=111463 RepID=A0A9P8N4J5_9HYPO|nr:uncharacterized protein HRG_03700 [Hirsutella rhossiliensis]KAH0965684.1 hypothetical protein HRG_03700 [Hirsutella rhossiliensis]
MPALAPKLDPAGVRAAPDPPSPSPPPPPPRTFRLQQQQQQQPTPDATHAETAVVPLAARQNPLPPASSESIIPATYGSLYDSPPPGTVVAIVLGSVAGFLLLVLLVYAALGFGPARRGTTESGSVVHAAPASVFSLRSRSRSRLAAPDPHHKHHRRRSSRRRSARRASETVEVRTREHFVVDHAAASRPPPPPAPKTAASAPRMPPPPPPPGVVVDDGDDEVVVIEEHSPPPPRRKSRRHSGRSRRSDEEARRGAYRDIEPDRFAGGDAPLRHVRREGSRRYSPDHGRGH